MFLADVPPFSVVCPLFILARKVCLRKYVILTFVPVDGVETFRQFQVMSTYDFMIS